jgi:hypothetical protein
MALIENGNNSAGLANVNTNFQLEVVTPTEISETGYLVAVGESHDGKAGVNTPVRRAIRVSTDGRLRTGVDTVQWSDTFNHAVLNTSAYQAIAATATLALTGGYLVFNAGNSVALNAVARIQTYKTFQLLGSSSLEVGFRVRFAINAQTNNVAELGVGFAATTVTPTDGAYFKLTTGGEIVGVMNRNGVEVTTPTLIIPSQNIVYYLRLVIDQDRLEFYVDGVLRGVLTTPIADPAISFSRSMPLLMRLYNSSATSSAQRMEVSDILLVTRDLSTNRGWETSQAGQLLHSISAPHGAAVGQTANFTNSTGPVSATLSNTVAGYATLGGKFQFAALAGAVTDYALFAFQVPLASAAGGNKNLVVRGLRIDTYNTGAAVATTGTVLEWGLGIGSTAVSLATADSATAGTRAPRRIPLGVQSFPVGAAIGAVANTLDVNLDAPIYVEAGTFLHVILQMPIGTATASQIIRGTVFINGYFE